VLAVVLTWMLAHNILYTYVAPFVAQAGLVERVDLVLLAFGAAALVGIAISGKTVDRYLRRSVLTSLAAFGAVGLLFAGWADMPAAIYLGVAAWGLSFGGAATLLQTALADAAGEGADVALSMNVVVWNSAIAAAGLLGGVLLNIWGPQSFPWAVVALVAVALAITRSAGSHGFAAAPRSGSAAVIGH